MLKDLSSEILKRANSFKGTTKIVAEHFATNIETYVFFSLDDIARQLGISASSVSRAIRAMGFKGYPELQEVLHSHLKQELSPVARFQKGKGANESLAIHSLKNDRDNINCLIEAYDNEVVQKIVAAMKQAKQVHVMGLRSAMAVSEFMALTLGQIRNNVFKIDLAQGTLPDSLQRIGKEDVLIVISFPRYSIPTIAVAKYAKDIGATVVGFSDSRNSPLFYLSDVFFACSYDSVSFFNSLIGPLAIANAILAEVAADEGQVLELRLAKLSQMMELSQFIFPKNTESVQLYMKEDNNTTGYENNERRRNAGE